MRTLICLLTLLLAFQANAQEVPDDYTAENMLELCKGSVRDQDPKMQSIVCTFRIQGIVSVMIENCLSIDQGYSPATILTSEIPPSKGAARQAFTNYMEANPDKWGLPWHIGLSMALSDTFPCNR